MKYLLSLVASTLFLITNAQTSIEPKVVQLDGSLTKTETYETVKKFLKESYENWSEVVETNSQTQGLIVIKSTSENYMVGANGSKAPQGEWHYTAKFEIKDGKYRFSVYDLYCINRKKQTIKAEEAEGFYKERLEELLKELDDKFSSISTKTKSKSNW